MDVADSFKRVLIIHYHFLPVHNVAVKRLVGYAKRLPAFGWQPEVLTRDWQGIDDQDPSWGLSWEPEIARDIEFPIHRVPPPTPMPRWEAKRVDAPWPLRKAASAVRLLPNRYPDDYVGWVKPAVKVAKTLASNRRIDAVISYCPPETNHLTGREVGRALSVPWVPFFGDLWGFFIAQFPPTLGGLIKQTYHRWWMRSAAACAAVSPYMTEYLSQTYRKPCALILTGFAPEEFADRRPYPKSKRQRMIVSHIGSLYPLDQKPPIFFDGLDKFLHRDPAAAARIQVRFVGSKCDDYLRALIQNRPCGSVCDIHPKVDSMTAVELVKDSDGLLAFNCTVHRTRHGTMSHPTKVFEAFGARRPLLAIPADGDWVDALLARTGAGSAASNAAEVADTLADWLSAWEENGEIPYSGKPDELAAFTVDRQVEHLAALLDSVTRHRDVTTMGTA